MPPINPNFFQIWIKLWKAREECCKISEPTRVHDIKCSSVGDQIALSYWTRQIHFKLHFFTDPPDTVQIVLPYWTHQIQFKLHSLTEPARYSSNCTLLLNPPNTFQKFDFSLIISWSKNMFFAHFNQNVTLYSRNM